MVYKPRTELLWQFRPEVSIRCWVPFKQISQFVQWVTEQAGYHYDRTVWNPLEHILEIAGSNQRRYPGRVPIDIFCPDKEFKSIVKLAWGGE